MLAKRWFSAQVYLGSNDPEWTFLYADRRGWKLDKALSLQAQSFKLHL